MDAKITKQRLANMLSYDWLKILVVIAVVVTGLTLIFTMAATRPTEAQTFTVYSYADVRTGRDFNSLSSALSEGKIFSYDILEVAVEDFDSNGYASSAFAARRAAGEGTVMFVSSYDQEGKPSTASSLYDLTYESMHTDRQNGSCYEPQYFFETEIKNYLIGFFGEDLQGALNEEKALIRFEERNGRDKRFRSEESKAQGAANERERLIKLRDDYLVLRAAFEAGKLSYTAVNGESGETLSLQWGEACPEGYYVASVDVSALTKITELLCCMKDGKTTAESLNMIVFYNLRDRDFDLCYETVSFLSYLTEKYA